MSVAFDEIEGALMVQLNAFQSTNVARPNVKFKPIKGTGYLEPMFLPVEAVQAALGTNGTNRQEGVFQILVWEPVGTGTGVLMRKADSIITQFKRGTDLTKGVTTVTMKSAWAGSLVQVGDWVYVPVTISWYSYTAN